MSLALTPFPASSEAAHPDLEHFLDHIDYLVERAGDRHVGIGLDFADEDEDDYEYFGYEEDTYPRPPWTWPSGIASFSDAKNIGVGLRRRRYTTEQIEAIARGNFLRVFAEVWNPDPDGERRSP